MKKIYGMLFLCTVILAVFSSCGNKAISTKNTDVENRANVNSSSLTNVSNQIANREKYQTDQNFNQAIDNFSFATTSKLFNSCDKNNISYSPVSLYMALSIAGTGSKNTTQDEIFYVLGTKGKDIDYISDQNSKLSNLLDFDDKIGKLKIANSIWVQKNIAINKTFNDNAVNKFNASLFNIDFGDKNSSKLISNWISKNTNGILSPNIDIDKEQIMTILNTIYYKNEWIDRFDKDKTKTDTFYLSNGSKIQCDFMNSTYSSHEFTRGSGFTASELNLKNGDSMIFVLPDQGISIESLVSTPEKVASIFNNKNNINGKVIFQVPKFSYGNSLKLNDILKSMGMQAAFKNSADFSGITNSTAFISSVKQQIHIGINEEGVQATAFTKIDYMGCARPKDEVAEMILNRPFIFAIKSNDTILFIGIVNNPAEKQ